MSARQIERLLRLDELLRSPQRHTYQTLAAALECSVRTIRYDFDFLRDRYHAPLAQNKTQGWHYTDPHWRLPTVPLALGELFALTLGARMLQSYAGSIYEVPLTSAIHQLAQRLPETMAIDLESLAQDRVHFRAGGEITLDPQIWMELLTACNQSQQVWLRYYSPQANKTSERTVDPYALDIYRASNPYLWGYCHLRQELRQFRIDRIQSLQVLATQFTPDPQFNLKDILKHSFQYEGGGKPVPVKIWFDASTAPYITERRWHPSQVIKNHPDGSITLHLEVSGLRDVKRWLLGYGRGAIAQSPPELVAMLEQETAIMARQNETGVFE